MEERKIYPISLLVSIIGGILISMAMTIEFIVPNLSSEELGQSKVVIFMLEIHECLNGQGLLGTILTVFFAALIFLTIKEHKKSKKNFHILLGVAGAVFGVLNTAGLCMYYLDCLPPALGGTWTILMLFVSLGWSCVFYIIAFWGMKLFQNLSADDIHGTKKLCKIWEYIDKHIFGFSFTVIFLCWMIWVILYYPASMDWDVFRQLNSFLGRNGGVPSNHDPWFSSCVIGICYKIGIGLGNENFGVFIYVFLRDILMALIYAKCVQTIKKFQLKRVVYMFALAFYAITPVWGAYAKHAFKDTFAAALFCWYILNTIVLLVSLKNKELGYKECALYAVSALVVSLFRNNCIYAVAPTTILIIGCFIYQKIKLRFCILVLSCIVLYSGYNNWAMNFGGVVGGSKVEAFAIPFQQTARTVRDHGEEITEEERMAIDGYLDYASLAENYNPILSDPVKDWAKWRTCSREDVMQYFITWSKMFFKYPRSYFEAAVAQSYGYYAFTPNLPEGAGNWNSGMTIFNWIYAENATGYDVHYVEKWETGRQILHAWSKIWDEIPLLNLTDSCAFYTWAIVLIGIYLIYKKKWLYLIPEIALLLIVLTCMASPVNDCFRYFSPVAASFPGIFILLGNEKKIKSIRITKKRGRKNG